MRALVSKKDPLLQAVLYENMITLISMSVPLIVGGSLKIFKFIQTSIAFFITKLISEFGF